MAPHRHFLLIEDDAFLRIEMAEQLADAIQCTVTEAGTIQGALVEIARGTRFDAILIDVDLPDGDGRDLCQRLRKKGFHAPILIVSGATREGDVIRGLDAGANDYIAKPFRGPELAARLRAQIRAFEASETAEIAIGPFLFRPGSKTLEEPGHGRPTRLTEKEVSLLKFLYRAGTEPVGRDILLQEVWGYSAAATTHTVETHIYRLRRKIESRPDSERILINEGGGYRLRLDRTVTSRRHAWPREAVLARAG